jgi:hypothetical protein
MGIAIDCRHDGELNAKEVCAAVEGKHVEQAAKAMHIATKQSKHLQAPAFIRCIPSIPCQIGSSVEEE